jgi:glycosyltransferase involved in cell wall biosynthesis
MGRDAFKISAIIPTYNRRHTLLQALASVYAQGDWVYEVIVVDDGSTDDTVPVVRELYPQVRLICQSNQGVSHARNRGIEAAAGNWVALLDSDDQWLPDKLKVQVAALIESPEARVCHTDEIWIRRGQRVNAMQKHQKRGGWIFPHCLPLCVMSPSSVLLHREVFERVGLFDETLPACEDYDLWLRVCSLYPVEFVQEALLLKYGGHADQLSRRHWGMDRFRVIALEKIIQSGQLNGSDHRSAVNMLMVKCDILIQGARKRGHTQRAEHYRLLQQKYNHHLVSQTCV